MVTTYAAIAGPFPKAGVVVASALVAVILLHRDRRVQGAAMLAALVIAPALLLAEIWSSPQLGVIHRHPAVAAVGAIVALVVLAAVAVLIGRHPGVFAGLVMLALPFRIPIQAGGTSSNLLVPLYFVVGAGALAFIAAALRDREPLRADHAGGRDARADPRDAAGAPDATAAPRSGWAERLLALYVFLYGVQSLYSSDFERALQYMVFFYVPFALAFRLLRELEWTPRLLRACAELVVGLAVLFTLVGFVEYATRTIFLNPQLIAANADHAYFTVNSVFFDANIFGRFLALVMVLLAAVLLYDRRQRVQLATLGLLAILWVGLVLTLSRSSMVALLVGLAVLAILRWKVPRVAVAGAAVTVVVVGAAIVAISPTTFGLNQGFNGVTAGRGGLLGGGIQLFSERPLWGYGSGSFETEYHARHPTQTLSASHTIPVTIAAEQGLIGEVAYVAFVVAAFVMLLRGAGSAPARAAVAAAFIALVVHTFLYADFLEDPITWTLLGVGVALAYTRRRETAPVGARSLELPAVPATSR